MSNAAVPLLARMLYGIPCTANGVRTYEPDFEAAFDVVGTHGVTASITFPTGDNYRVTVEWLPEVSP